MENQHKLITGYGDLTQEEITLVNEIKATGENLRVLCKKISERTNQQYQDAGALDAEAAVLDQRLTAIYDGDEGERLLRTGLMWLTRAVTQPGHF